MKMNYTDALTIAIDTLTTTEQTETTAKAIEKLSALRTTYQHRAETRPVMSDEKKAAQSAARKAATAAARAELMAQVGPVMRKYLVEPHTAKEVFEMAKDELPSDFTWNRVQSVLVRDMKDELIKVEAKGKPNTYQIR